MARVYSSQLFEAAAVVGVTDIGPPAAGTIWVVRHMTAASNLVPFVPLRGFTVYTSVGALVMSVGPMGVKARCAYDWSGRHVIGAGEHLVADSADAGGWSLLVSGYVLTLP